jgi:uncharacterized protein (TIGR02271 family)
MSWSAHTGDITAGTEVFGSDGGKVGTVAEVHPNYIVVEKGFFFPTDYFIPMSAIASSGDGQIYLNVSKDNALHSGWDIVPTNLSTVDVSATAMTAASADDATATYVDTSVTGTEEEIRIPVMEEELSATVRPVEAGSVRIEKDVVTEQRTLDVPVTEERIHVERRVVDRPVTAADVNAFEETVIEVPLRSETVDVQKYARVAEEVVISKDTVQRTEHVSDTVRREEVIVDEETIADPTLLEGVNRGTARQP